MMGDQLAFHAEARRKHDPAVQRFDNGAQPTNDGLALNCVECGHGVQRNGPVLEGSVCIRHFALHGRLFQFAAAPRLDVTQAFALAAAQLFSRARRINRSAEDNIDVAWLDCLLGRNFQNFVELWMDLTDRKILAIIQEDSSLPVAEIAAQVNLSQTPCWRRIQKLEESGVITKRVALVDPDKIGLGLTVFVEIESGDHSEEWLERFASTVTEMPEVMEIYRMAGDVDYLLRITVADMAAVDDFYKRLISSVPLKNVTSRFAMERVKYTTAYPVPRT
jgi:Lrp/AsnC family transcriptional regulator